MASGLLDTLNDISTSLAILGQQVRAEAQAGLGSRNKVAEHVLLPVLRIVYDAPGLVNTNKVAANFPGIDLYDDSLGLGVQVTAEATARKISQTIEKSASGPLPIKQLVVALLTEKVPRFKASTRKKWRAASQGRFAFDPNRDILVFGSLLARIQNLPPSKITAIAAVLRALVRGTHPIHLLPHLRKQVESQLEEEQRVARYIPDVFVETQDTKYQARCFAHPRLFLRRIAGWFDRKPLATLNRLATMSGLPPVSTPPSEALTAAGKLDEVTAAGQEYTRALESFDPKLKAYSKIDQKSGYSLLQDAARAYVLAETMHYIQSSATSVQFTLDDRRKELDCVVAQVFLLTGPAGQGKTNFLCDFTQRFLLRHDIPCAYVTARQLSRIPNPDLAEVVCRLIFPNAVSSLDEGLTMLSVACEEKRQPFVLVIDGLNEHPDFRVFAGQLEYLLEKLIRYKHVRVLMTCRSEFLKQRFGALLSGRLAPSLHLAEAHGQRFEDKQYSELVERYFQFFKVQRSRVSTRVMDFLQRDILLLRFFCEAYGARGRDESYQQPLVAGVYRQEIFELYLKDKLGRAERTLADDRSAARPLVRQVPIRRVLSVVAAYMLERRQYTDVPRTVVPATLDAELTALLDEELILRHDLGPAPSLLAEPAELLNFTFDEMRDFLLAQHLLAVYEQNAAEFDRLVALQQPTTAQSVEGIQRFLFYASRGPTSRSFFEHYHTHPWYVTVYDTEVFAVPQAHLNADDRHRAQMALTGGGARAQHFARELSFCWDSSVYPVLNLDVLLTVARNAELSFFSGVIVPTFGRKLYREGSLGDAFCSFAEREILREIAPEEREPYRPVFRLLLLLLPVAATPTLESPAMKVFRRLISAEPVYALELLREALDDGSRWNRAFLWRLLSAETLPVSELASFVATAEADLEEATSDAVLRSEAKWFLSHVSGSQR